MQNENSNNIIFAIVISAVILISWTWLYEKPRVEARKIENQKIIEQKQEFSDSKESADFYDDKIDFTAQNNEPRDVKIDNIVLSKEEIIEQTKDQRVWVQTPELHGSINLKGMVFDDLTLANYQESLDPKSKEVTLLSPFGSAEEYEVNFGYRALDKGIEMPNKNSLWKSDGQTLTPTNPVIFSWQNKQKIKFEVKVEIDEDYMFFVTQSIINKSSKELEIFTTTNIRRSLPQMDSSTYILHEGPIGVFDGILTEKSYSDVRDEKGSIDLQAQDGWFGITDKYWLVSIIPDTKSRFETKFSYDGSNYKNTYSVSSKGQRFAIESGRSISFNQKMFAGAKKVSLLDKYEKELGIKRFDLAVDFGWYYFLTKPFFFILQFFNNLLGNYGLAILAITVLIKLAMFPLATKSYTSIAKIKKLQPKIDKIREEYKDKKMEMNKAIMQLYKKEKVNPVSGCLPMLVQIPVFFSLYKVLYLTIDMRHAPFYGWIKDLSAPDPTSILNLFGILPFDVAGVFAIGLWPIFMGLTMVIQQKLNPQPSDPVQAKVMKLLPFILIFVFAPFPAGLLIYWTWSNSLSILQQWYITRKFSK
ncbi:MAG: YidC/Oxa1 family membrane protein insertase [Rickettsiales bacterium]|jgi:YidC/Oxa1 family membrane protein insertase